MAGRGWLKKKLVGRKILSVVKFVDEKWWVMLSPFGPILTRGITGTLFKFVLPKAKTF